MVSLAVTAAFLGCSGGEDPNAEDAQPFGWDLPLPLPTANETPAPPHYVTLQVVDRIPRSGWSEGIDVLGDRIWHAWPSVIRELDMEGNVLAEHEPPSTYSESLTWFGGRLFNLSYHNANVYAGTVVDGALVFTVVGTVPDEAGWGITHDGTNLIVSGNGSENLYVLDGETFAHLRTITTPVDDLEDLAWDGRYIWASSYSEYPGQVFRIDPDTGNLVDLHTLPDPDECSIVDGIAVSDGLLYVTGKRCPWIYVAPLPAE